MRDGRRGTCAECSKAYQAQRRATVDGKEASRLQDRITHEALRRLREAHRAEYERLREVVSYEMTRAAR